MRPRIAYLTPNAIFHPNRGGRIRAYHLWRAMSAYADVIPMIIGDAADASVRGLMRLANARFYPRRQFSSKLSKGTERPTAPQAMPGLWEVANDPELPPALLDDLAAPAALVRHCLNSARIERILRDLSRLRPDLIVLCDTTLGLLAPYVRSLGVNVVVGPHNFDSALYESMAARAPTETARTWNASASSAFRAAEEIFAPCVDQLWVCSEADARRFGEKLVDKSKIQLVPNVFDVSAPLPISVDSVDLVFVGQANYYPNEDAIRNLFTVSKVLDSRRIAHRMRIVGRVSDRIKQEAKAFSCVEMLGYVASVDPFIEDAAIVPIPLTMGGGTRLKILEALSKGRPVLSTPVGIEGIDCEDGVSAVVEPDLAAFPDRIEELLTDRARAQRIALAGWNLAERRYSHEALLGHVGRALAELGLAADKPSGAILGRNLGVSVVSESASFNSLTRLFAWTMVVRLAAPFDALSAELACDTIFDLPNAFVQIRPVRVGTFRFKASAILPTTIVPETLELRLSAWGKQVFLKKAPRDIPCQTFGLLTIEPVGSLDMEFTGWSNSGLPELKPELRAPLDENKKSLSGVVLFSGRYSRSVQAVEAAGDSGEAQVFSEVAHWLARDRQTSNHLEQFKNKHTGEVAWIIGNGPSVRVEDLDRLKGRLTLCFNRFHLAHASTSLRPTYTFTADAQMIEDFGQRIVDESSGVVFVAHHVAPDLIGDYIWIRQTPVFPPLFSKRPDCVVSPGGSTPFVAMQIAYYMGVRKFYFYGADFTFRFAGAKPGADAFRSATGEGNHFIADYRSDRPWCPPSLVDIGTSFLTAKLIMEAEGGFIKNVTRGGALEMFPRLDFETALDCI